MNYKKSIFFVLFVGLGTVALNIKLNQIAGSNASFTLFDSLAPIAGSFLGTVPGVVAVLLMQIFNLVVHGAGQVEMGLFLRLFPTLFAVMYFSNKSRWNIAIPLIAIGMFIIHPIGGTVWYYSMFWLIPVICYPFREHLILKSLGSTFAAHSVGGVLWLYAFNLPKEIWISLIPIVIIERLLFAGGIAVNYVLIKKLVSSFDERMQNETVKG